MVYDCWRPVKGEFVSTSRPEGGGQSLLRLINSVAVLSALRESGPATITDLTRVTRLSRPTVEAAVDDLVAQGWAAEHEARGQRRVGRPARRFVFRGDSGYVLGFDVGAHRVLGVLADLNGDTVHVAETRVDPRLDADARLSVVRDVGTRCLNTAGVDRSSVMAVAVGCPGIIASDGTVTLSTVIPGWVDFPLARRLSRSFPCPVLVDNDANLAALAERAHGVARDVDDLVYLLIGRRIGAGLVLGGRVHRGFGGAAGEIGLLDFATWERSRELLLGPATGDSGRSHDHRVTGRILDRARAGEADAVRIVDEFCAVLARQAVAMTLTVDPEMIVLGGGLASAGDLLLPRLEKHISDVCVRTPRLAASTVGQEAVVLGAVRLALSAADEALQQRAKAGVAARG
ncbi:transcriptional regulator/sugar kinase [Saccharomonospora cyanea NA-134]|uniref:Transcriptional regulator/sugar kinase n=1 Tax=Saccharomonospora cyanea NA-134 TaxID=882082 RepID=H5XGR8_9PSEU|nr:transcriptional regulator/sugar kinase [Saccharomonospora cyanea NA-134]